jgi:hypothetical protein
LLSILTIFYQPGTLLAKARGSMKSSSLRFLAVAFATFWAGSLSAAPYSFSYEFINGGALLSGRFDGTPNGDFIENIVVTSVKLDGNPLLGSFQIGHFDEGSGSWQLGAFFSPDVHSNNFFLADGDLVAGDGYSFLFFLDYRLSLPIGAYLATPDMLLVDDAPTAGRWSFKRLSDPIHVPDAGASGVVFLSALSALALIRQRVRGSTA